MAYVTQDQALNYLTGSEQPQQPQTSGDSGGAFIGGSGPAQARGGIRPAFTNVSAYMKANQPDLGKGLQAVQTSVRSSCITCTRAPSVTIASTR